MCKGAWRLIMFTLIAKINSFSSRRADTRVCPYVNRTLPHLPTLTHNSNNSSSTPPISVPPAVHRPGPGDAEPTQATRRTDTDRPYQAWDSADAADAAGPA